MSKKNPNGVLSSTLFRIFEAVQIMDTFTMRKFGLYAMMGGSESSRWVHRLHDAKYLSKSTDHRGVMVFSKTPKFGKAYSSIHNAKHVLKDLNLYKQDSRLLEALQKLKVNR